MLLHYRAKSLPTMDFVMEYIEKIGAEAGWGQNIDVAFLLR